MKKVLFLCGRNKLRSPTAERIFADRPGLEVASAGLNLAAYMPVSADLIGWANIIFVMEPGQRAKVAKKFRASLKGKRLICLNIADKYEYMAAKLVQMLEHRVGRVLGR